MSLPVVFWWVKCPGWILWSLLALSWSLWIPIPSFFNGPDMDGWGFFPNTSRWWFQRFFIFIPIPGEMIPILTKIFQMGWNHRLDFFLFCMHFFCGNEQMILNAFFKQEGKLVYVGETSQLKAWFMMEGSTWISMGGWVTSLPWNEWGIFWSQGRFRRKKPTSQVYYSLWKVMVGRLFSFWIVPLSADVIY